MATDETKQQLIASAALEPNVLALGWGRGYTLDKTSFCRRTTNREEPVVTLTARDEKSSQLVVNCGRKQEEPDCLSVSVMSRGERWWRLDC